MSKNNDKKEWKVPRNLFGKYFSNRGKVYFVDLNESDYGKYLKICQKHDEKRQSVFIPEEKIFDLRDIIEEACSVLTAA